MKWLFSFCVLFLYVKASAQCTQKWLRFNSNSRDTLTLKAPAANDTIDVFGKKISAQFVDSVIRFLEAKENLRKDKQALFSDYRIFHYQACEVILKSAETRSIDGLPLKLYHFLISDGFNGSDWSDDAYYGFTYTKQYGTVFKQYWEKDMRTDVKNKSILLFNSCKPIPKACRESILFSMGP